jgi:hypothetical protein
MGDAHEGRSNYLNIFMLRFFYGGVSDAGLWRMLEFRSGGPSRRQFMILFGSIVTIREP